MLICIVFNICYKDLHTYFNGVVAGWAVLAGWSGCLGLLAGLGWLGLLAGLYWLAGLAGWVCWLGSAGRLCLAGWPGRRFDGSCFAGWAAGLGHGTLN